MPGALLAAGMLTAWPIGASILQPQRPQPATRTSLTEFGGTDTLLIRNHPQTLHVYGTRGAGDPVIVSSGDGGWIHLGPQVAELLARRGYFVVGFDTKRYLESFTSATTALRAEEEPADYRVLVEHAARGSSTKPILIGVSEGAGLSVLAATDPQIKAAISGVICLGLPDLNELGWRWRDSLIYITHGVPKEPTFSTSAIIGNVSPVPLAAIHSTHDEFVPLAQVQRVLQAARGPAKLWIVNASDHRFSDNVPEFTERLLEAIAWIRQPRTQ
jgi:pimeloyl-ACP methyl ester carboxylesterase